ncbi:MAG: hypothetical protein EOM10_00305 [Opitutae bacterium]|nr:hypothetical protein [Opitutae bacterium]
MRKTFQQNERPNNLFLDDGTIVQVPVGHVEYMIEARTKDGEEWIDILFLFDPQAHGQKTFVSHMRYMDTYLRKSHLLFDTMWFSGQNKGGNCHRLVDARPKYQIMLKEAC